MHMQHKTGKLHRGCMHKTHKLQLKAEHCKHRTPAASSHRGTATAATVLLHWC